MVQQKKTASGNAFLLLVFDLKVWRPIVLVQYAVNKDAVRRQTTCIMANARAATCFGCTKQPHQTVYVRKCYNMMIKAAGCCCYWISNTKIVCWWTACR